MSLPPATRDHLTLSYYNPNWGQWENTRTLEAGELMRRMGRQYEELAIAVGVELVAVMDSAAAAFREFEESYRRVMVTLYQEDTDG